MSKSLWGQSALGVHQKNMAQLRGFVESWLPSKDGDLNMVTVALNDLDDAFTDAINRHQKMLEQQATPDRPPGMKACEQCNGARTVPGLSGIGVRICPKCIGTGLTWINGAVSVPGRAQHALNVKPTSKTCENCIDGKLIEYMIHPDGSKQIVSQRDCSVCKTQTV